MKCSIVLAAALLFGACSDDTGLLVEVHGDQLQITVHKLETMVIVDQEGAPPDSLQWGDTQPVLSTVEGVDLLAEPYTVLIEPAADEREASLWIAAIAYDDDSNLIGWAELDSAVAFEPGAVKRIAIHLEPAWAAGPDCVVKDGTVVIRNTDDCDGDGADYAIDCNDLDPEIVDDQDGDPLYCHDDCAPGDPNVYQGNKEECDGVDNDCDEASSPEPIFCAEVEYDVEGNLTSCRVGQQLCAEDNPDAGYGPCLSTPVEADGNLEACDRWGVCNEVGGDACFFDGTLRCTLDVDAGAGGACVPAVTPLGGLVAGDACTWRLIGNIQQGGWNAGLRVRNSVSQPVTFVDTCDAEFVVTEADLVPRIYVVERFDGEVARLFAILLRPARGSCEPGGETLHCELSP